ncbi:MAG: Zn-ribbon domain-containing OB-fold protein [Candidatus Binatia bacterium]
MPEPSEARAHSRPRPIVPFLRLGSNGDKPYLVGKKCSNCGAVYLGRRVACSKCGGTGPFNEIHLADKGRLWVYSIVYQSAPGIPTPYVAGIVDLPEGVSVRCTIVNVEPKPEKIDFGMPVEMVTRKVREDQEGNDVIAFFFQPARG